MKNEMKNFNFIIRDNSTNGFISIFSIEADSVEDAQRQADERADFGQSVEILEN